MKKNAIFLLMLLLLAFSFIACNSKKPRTGTGKTAALTASGYPITARQGALSLSYWIPMNAGASKFIQSYSENSAFQELVKRTGINLSFIHPAAGMEQEQFNLLMVSGDLPDIIGSANLYKGGEFQGMYDGFFLDLTELLPEYAPDYYKLIQDDPEFFRLVSDNDGRICGFYAYKPQGDPPFTRVILQKDLLKKIGKDILPYFFE